MRGVSHEQDAVYQVCGTPRRVPWDRKPLNRQAEDLEWLTAADRDGFPNSAGALTSSAQRLDVGRYAINLRLRESQHRAGVIGM
jgi:hypothetical protein